MNWNTENLGDSEARMVADRLFKFMDSREAFCKAPGVEKLELSVLNGDSTMAREALEEVNAWFCAGGDEVML